MLWAGHANISTTVNFYLVSDAQRVREAFARAKPNGKLDAKLDVEPILSPLDYVEVDGKQPSRYRDVG